MRSTSASGVAGAFILASAAGTLLAMPALGQFSFRGLGDLSGGANESLARSVSDDGIVVVGRSLAGQGPEAFRWSDPLRGGVGLEGLGDLPGGPPIGITYQSEAYGVSSDGSVVIGVGRAPGGNQAFRWTRTLGMVGLIDPVGGEPISVAFGVSGDGQSVVGTGSGVVQEFEAVRWTGPGWSMGGNAQLLGDLPGGVVSAIAWAISPDKSVIVGSGASATRRAEACTWINGALQSIHPVDSFTESVALGVSGDGRVVVGYRRVANVYDAFRWTSGTGMVSLGDLENGELDRVAYAATADGSVIVGRARTTFGNEAFVWDPTNGMRLLLDVLVDAGVDMTGWQPWAATDITPDGKYIVGYGQNPQGWVEAFIARVPGPCRADYTGDGEADVNDFFRFLFEYAENMPRGDFNLDGSTDVDDFFAFLLAYGTGCEG